MLVGEVWARMGLDSKQYEKDLNRLEADTKKRALTLGNVFRNAFSFTIGMGMFQAIQRGFQATVGEAVNFNSMMEQARIGFTTMLGSAEKAQAFLDDMADFAARTPFEFPDLLESSKRMLAMGFAASEILTTIEAVGNAAAGLGLGREGINRITLALGQMRAKAKVSGEEMRQLTEAGVPAWDMLAEALGMTTAEVMKMSERGLIPADKAIKIMVEGMNKRFPDMMKNMENTWQGVTSTIKDVWRMTMGTLTSGLFKGLTTWLQGVRDWATDFYNTFRQFGLQVALTKSFGAEFATMVNIVRSAVSIIIKYFVWWYGVLKRNWTMIKFIATMLLIYATVTRTAAIATSVFSAVSLALNGQLVAKIPLLSLVSTAMGIYKVQMALASAQGIVLTGVIAKLRVALYSLWTALGPIGWGIIAISLALGAGISIWSKYKSAIEQTKLQNIMANVNKQTEDFGESTETATDGTGELADTIEKAGKAANKNLQSFDEVHQLMEDTAGASMDTAAGLDLSIPETKGLDEVFELGVPDMSNIQASWKEILSAIWQDVIDWAGRMKERLGNLWEWIKQGAANLWDGVKQKWNGFIDWIKGWTIWSWIRERWEGLKTWVGNLWDGVKEKWSDFKEWAGNLWEGAKERWGSFTNWVQEKWSNFRTKAGEIWEGIKTNVQEKWEALKTNAPIIWENIKTSIQTRWDNLKSKAGETWENIKTEIQERWYTLKTDAPTIWENIKTEIASRWDALKTDAPLTWENIRTTIAEKWDNLKTNAPIAWESIKKTISDKWNELRNNVGPAWGNIKTAIADKWQEIKEDAFNWGKNLIDSFVEGIKEKFKSLKNTLSSIGTTIKSYFSGSGISVSYGNFSVAGASSLAVPKLARGTNYIPQDMFAYLHEGEAVVPKEYNPAAGSISMEALEQAVYRAFINAIKVVQATHSGGSDNRDLVIKINNTELAREQLPALIRESQRQGFEFILRPQRV